MCMRDRTHAHESFTNGTVTVSRVSQITHRPPQPPPRGARGCADERNKDDEDAGRANPAKRAAASASTVVILTAIGSRARVAAPARQVQLAANVCPTRARALTQELPAGPVYVAGRHSRACNGRDEGRTSRGRTLKLTNARHTHACARSDAADRSHGGQWSARPDTCSSAPSTSRRTHKHNADVCAELQRQSSSRRHRSGLAALALRRPFAAPSVRLLAAGIHTHRQASIGQHSPSRETHAPQLRDAKVA